MLLTTAQPQRQLVSLALILLLLLSQLAAASEVAEHALCNHGVELTVVEPSGLAVIDRSSIVAGNPGADHSTHPHLCHVHPPAHSLPAGALPEPTDRSTQVFPPFRVALTDIATAPPVPPPNA